MEGAPPKKYLIKIQGKSYLVNKRMRVFYCVRATIASIFFIFCIALLFLGKPFAAGLISETTGIFIFLAGISVLAIVSNIFSRNLSDPLSDEEMRKYVREEERLLPADASSANKYKKYVSQCVYGDGKIYRLEDDEVVFSRDKYPPLWHFKSTWKNGHRLFTLFDPSEQILLTIQCNHRLPFARFVMTVNDEPVCSIKQTSFLLNNYALEFVNGAKWTFHIRLFSILCRGVSNVGDEVRVQTPRHDTWQIEISTGADNLYLVAALALIHRERERFS